MNAKNYIKEVLESVSRKHADKPEFVQAISEFLPTLEPYIE